MSAETTQDKLIRILGNVAGAKSILRSTAHYTDAMALEYLEVASDELRAMLVELEVTA